MKLSLNWISDYIDLPGDLELSKLAYDLTMSTVEVEGVHFLKDMFEGMVVGVVREIQKHPDADKLVVCMVDVGDEGDAGGGLKQIVCGGTNLSEGMKVAVAKPGSKVRWHGEGELVELKKTKVRGIESYGMICSSSEIGLFDLFPFEDEATIMDISEFDAAAGTPLAEALDLDDVILEIDNKSLTNRPDLWGHYGIAREISAIYDLPLKELSGAVPTKTDAVETGGQVPCSGEADFKIIIDDTERCPRYVGVNIDGLFVKPSPFWLQSRIWRVGMRPINAIVDVTNYVMLATGQPTHAFDSDIIKENIVVRRASDGEKLLLLNGAEMILTPEDLVIADGEGAVALAGVMGGAKDSILTATDKIILEIANFDALSVRRTTIRHEIRTESSTRFEKSIDPQRVDLAHALAMQLFAELYPDMLVTGFHDNYPKPLKGNTVEVSVDWLEKRLGKRIANEDLTSILKRLGFDVDFEKGGLSSNLTAGLMRVTVPSWRSTGDISIPDDIIEEVARIHGFENFEARPIETTFEGIINQPMIDIDRKIREYLAFRCGMNEVFTYPWVSEEYVNAVMPGNEGLLEISAPPSAEERFLRCSLLPGLCKATSDNLRYFTEFAIFESAQVFFDRDYSVLNDSREKLPLQRRNVAGAFVGGQEDAELLFRKAKGALESMSRFVHMEPFTFEQKEKPHWADDVVWLNIFTGGQGGQGAQGSQRMQSETENLSPCFKLGSVALLAKRVSLDCGIKNAAVVLFDIDIDSLKPFASRTNEFAHIPEYPMTDYDVSLIFDSSVKWEKIFEVATAKMGADSMLRAVSFVDEYKGKQIPDGKKSVTLRLAIGSLSKTLTSEEIENCANAIIKRLVKTLGAEAR
ncbi:MAG: phenylalanine--tRNA ligase subunit beta [Oscillospiraceae bacterium]|nr:phenylalanine--tRNA ligase subunit beta [Oscillospiraceae bacterium]